MESIFRSLILILVPFLALSFGGVQKWAFTSMQTLLFALVSIWTLIYLYGKKNNSRLHLSHNRLVFFITFLPFIFFILFQVALIPEVLIRSISNGLFELKERIWLNETVKFPNALSINRYETATAFIQVISCFLTVIITSFLFRKKKDFKTGLYFMFFTGFLISLFGIMQYLSWDGKIYWTIPISGGAPFGPFINHNHFAAFANMTVMPFLALALHKYRLFFKIKESGGREAYILFLSLVVIITAIFMSGSRGGVVGLLAGITVMLLLLRREGELRLNIFILLIIGLLVAGLFFIVERWEVLGTLSSLFNSHEDISFLYRIRGWESAIAVFKDFFLAGTGLGTFSEIFLIYRPESMLTTFRHAHNEYVQLLTETGILGLTSILIPLCYFLWKFNPLSVNDSDKEMVYARVGIFSGLVALLIHNTVEFNMRVPANSYLFSITLGLYLTSFDEKNRINRAAGRRFLGTLFFISTICLTLIVNDVAYPFITAEKPINYSSNTQSLIPHDPQDLIEKGDYYAARNMYPQTEEYFHGAFDIAPLNASIWARYAVWLERREGGLDESIRYLTIASKLDPVNATYRFHLAGLMLKNGDTLNSINELRQLVKQRSEWFNRALELIKDTDIDLINIADKEPDRLILVGRMYEKKGNYDYAIKCYKEAVKLGLPDDKYLDIYAGFLMRRKEYELLRNIDELYSESVPSRAIYWKSEAFFASDDFNEGVKLLSGLVDSEDTYLKEYGERLVSILLNSRDFEKALSLMERLVELDGEDYKRLNLMSLAYEGMGRWMKAVNILKKMAVLKPVDFNVSYRLAGLYEHLGMKELVASELEKCLDIKPDNFKVRLKLGDIYFAMNRRDKALYHYRNILASDPVNRIVLSRLNRF